MRRGWFLVLILSLGLNAGLLYNQFSGPPEEELGGRGKRGEKDFRARDVPADSLIAYRLELLTEQLALDDGQQKEIARILGAFVPRVMEERQRVGEARSELRSILASSPDNKELIEAHVRQLSSIQTNLDLLVAESLAEELSVLSGEQRQRYLEDLPRGPGPSLRR